MKLKPDIEKRLRVAEQNLRNAVQELKQAEADVNSCLLAVKLLEGIGRTKTIEVNMVPSRTHPVELLISNTRRHRHRRNYAHIFRN